MSDQDLGIGDGGSLSNPDLTPPVPQIKHVVLIVQENHTFDAYFGRYCTAATNSNPTCTTGPGCCERAPDMEPMGHAPLVLDDNANGSINPDHTQACELQETDGGKMDKYVVGVSGCSKDYNFSIATTAVKTYYDYAAQYALADRYFQPISGQSSSNDMYFAKAKYVFTDNALIPKASGHGCWYPTVLSPASFSGETTIADLLISGGKSFAVYAEGYTAMKTSIFLCPGVFPSDCTFSPKVPGVPNTCVYDPSDYPFQYYSQFADNPTYIKDFTSLGQDIAAGTLPTFSFVKGLSYHSEHPYFYNTISLGAAFVKNVADAIQNSQYGSDTLVLVTWDEGGGFFDHIAPPGNSPVDNKPYGTRIPLLALGKFAKKNYVSHVQMEHSSILKFLEYNFLNGQTGQLGGRDAVVNNLGSMLDPNLTGVIIPEN